METKEDLIAWCRENEKCPPGKIAGGYPKLKFRAVRKLLEKL